MQKTLHTILTAFVVVATALATTAMAQENYSTNWSGHRTLIVNTTVSGANVTGNVLNFPLLVRLTTADSAVFASAKGNGADIRFTKANNTTRLHHEIERWDSAGRSASIWVRMDTVMGNAMGTLRLHWGNAAAADSSKGSAVFDTANGFEAVFHMNGAAGDTLRDATANGYRGIPTVGSTGGSTVPADTTGVIGKAKSFGGNNDDTDVGANTGGGYRLETSAGGRTNNSFNYQGNDAEFTLSVWTNFVALRPTGNFSRRRGLVTKASALTDGSPANGDTTLGFAPSNNDPLTQWYLRPNNVDRIMHMQRSTIPSGGTAGFSIVASGGVTNVVNNWNFVSYAAAGVTANGNRFRLYNSSGTTTREINDEAGLNKDVDVFIGALAAGSGSKNNGMLFLNGMIDEVRISKVARSANWVDLEYANQRAGSNVVTTLSAPANLRYVQGNTADNDTIVFQTGVAYNIVPTYTGGPVDSFAIATGGTSWPAGITLNKFTGALTGTPTATIAVATRTITAYSAAGNTTRAIVRSAVLGPTTNLTYSPDTATYPVGLSVVNGPTWAGRAPTKFTVSAGTLPAGLVIDSVTGVISGTPTAQAAAANFTVRATNTTGPDTATKVLRLTIGAAENFSTGWSQHRDWWLNTQPNGANVNKLVRLFPVLVRLDSTNFNTGFAQTSGGGRDLRFSKADNTTRLAHQIDTWDSAGKRASIWVLVDSVPAYGVKALRMHWGNATAANTSSGPAVFRTADGFRAVWHMNGATAASNEPDATANGMTATQTGEPPPAAGIIGGARSFANTGTTVSDYMRVLGSATTLHMPAGSNYSVSAWANLSNTQTHATLLSKHDLAFALKLNSGSSWEFFEYNESWNSVTGPLGEVGVWVHLIGVQNGLDAAFYANGARVDFGISPVTGTGARNEGVDVVIGSEPTSNTAQRRPYGGLADEIRIAAVSRDTAWAKLEYENQRPTGQTLVSFTQPVSIGGDMAARSLSFGITAKPEGEGVLFRVQGTGETMGTRLTLVDMFGRTVWSRTLAASAGTQDVLWNGQAQSGGRVSSGVYVVRAALLDASGKAVQVVERKLPLTR